MANLNTVFIKGNVTRDPEVRYVKTGTALCSFAIGHNRHYRKGDEMVKETSFIDVKGWGELAERASEQLAKGTEVIVSGRLEQERWQAADGTARSRIVVVADKIDVVGQPRGAREPRPGQFEATYV